MVKILELSNNIPEEDTGNKTKSMLSGVVPAVRVTDALQRLRSLRLRSLRLRSW
jgi:ribonucleotide reductase alpha subunit